MSRNHQEMNQALKSIFVMVFPLIALVGLVLAIDQYIHQYMYAAVGLAMISIPVLFFFGRLFLVNVPRTTANLHLYSLIMAAGGLVLAIAFFLKDAESFAAIGFIILVCWVLYLKWYSNFGDRSNDVLKEGVILPRLSFENVKGEPVVSDEFRGKKSIIMFYRGNWCPLCVAQINELASEYKALEAKGIQTILVSPQPHSHTEKLSKKHDVDFQFLVDKDNRVAKQLNIFSKNGLPTGFQVLGYDSDTVMPTVILTDERGKIIHTDLNSNYRVRPEPAELMKYFN